MSDLQVGDIVLPVDFQEFEAAFAARPLRVTHVFKNGNIRAKTDDGRWRSDGAAEYFYSPNFDKNRRDD